MERKLRTGDRWGDWFLNAERNLLEYRPGATEYRNIAEGCDYYVPLTRMVNANGVAEWTSHLNGQKWMTATVIGDFQSAIRDIFHPEINFKEQGVSPEYFKQRFAIMSDEELRTGERKKCNTEGS